ncbi:glycosyltransferase family 4 protein [Scandinavium goeteborgense]|uniref:glycosyltransferase family 4 protein n=1 Tax=Scandinavium goeteborgense TaxID=1851514 RepID=UPI0021656C11|nr:glycosyltransferase family 4 protein [Scandinavium goeteborgense]MCS2154918.1 glycosyltransferase family 4 protein [Scandinavium goeteborgense]
MEKIIFVIADITFVGGIERVNTLLANKFSDEGYCVEIVSLYNTNGVVNYTVNENIKIKFVNNTSYKGSPGSVGRLFAHIKSQLRLFKTLKASRGDFYIINTFPMAALSFFNTFFKGKFVVVEHVHHDYYKPVLKKLRCFLYKIYDKVVCINESDFNKFSENLSNTAKISNPLSFRTDKTSNLESKKIIAVGRLEYQKGFDLLIDVFSKVQRVNTEWELHIYGVGTCRQFLNNKIEAYSLDNIKLKGSVDNIHEIYPEYSIFAFSSRFEGFGMVLLEAMECGLPCISFDCPTGPAEILGNGEYGILIENGNIDEYAKNLLSLMESFKIRTEFSKLSRVRVEEFSIDKIFSEWESLIHS